MFGKVIDLIVRNGRMLSVLLIVVVAANALFQTYTHKTTALTAWKGGGFGMYTTPHVESRSVWLTFKREDGVVQLRVWPEAQGMTEWRDSLNLSQSGSLGRITSMAEGMSYFPRTSNADPLLELASRIRWREDLRGGMKPADGKTFEEVEISVQVYENEFDIRAGTLTRVQVYDRTGGQGS